MREKQFLEYQQNPWMQEENECIYSGDIDWPFRVEAISIENIIQIFKHIDTIEDRIELKQSNYDLLPNYNGLTTPNYITQEPPLNILINEHDQTIPSRISK